MPDGSQARAAVRSLWANEGPDFSGVVDAATAGTTLTALLSATIDFLAYRRLDFAASAIQLVSSDRGSYLRFQASTERTADLAVLLGHAISEHAADANALAELTGEKPRWRSTRILVLANADGATIKRLDVDPLGELSMTWHGVFDPAQFTEIAVALSLLLTHLVANVFDSDDGSETFEESFEWLL